MSRSGGAGNGDRPTLSNDALQRRVHTNLARVGGVVDLFTDPGLLEAATAEHREKAGPDFEYVSLVGDRDPPLDYRKPPEGGSSAGRSVL